MTDKQALTAKQADVLDFIKNQILENGYPPSRLEIAKRFNTHLNNITKYTNILVAKGHIEKDNSTRPVTIKIR